MSHTLALSVAQPWASLILTAGKQVENRTWMTHHRGPLVLHASRSWDESAFEWMRENVGRMDWPTRRDLYPRGVYLGVVDLLDVHPVDACGCDCSPWAMGPETGTRFHWRMFSPRPFPSPIDGRGSLKLFPVPDEVLQAISQLYANDEPDDDIIDLSDLD